MANRRRSVRLSPPARIEYLQDRLLLSGTFTVTDSGDASTGQTLRAAILAANAPNGPTTIDFAFPGTAPFIIQPATSLPTIVSAVTIDGTSQTGYSGKPLIMLDGSKTNLGSVGLFMVAPSVVVEGLSIGNFTGGGILIGEPGHDQIESSYIGVATDGTTAAPNGGAGIDITDGGSNPKTSVIQAAIATCPPQFTEIVAP